MPNGIIRRFPTGVGTADSWTSAAGGNKWLDVDDPLGSPDDISTYIFKDDSNGIQHFTFDTITVPSFATGIVNVRYVCRARSSGAPTGPGFVRLGVRVNGTNYTNIADMNTDSDWETANVPQTDNPDTATGWTIGDVEGTSGNPLQEIFVRATDMAASDRVEVSQFYIEITYSFDDQPYFGYRGRKLRPPITKPYQ